MASRARAIDAAFAEFSRSPAAQGATRHEIETLCCWAWQPGHTPCPAEYENLLAALRLGAAQRQLGDRRKKV